LEVVVTTEVLVVEVEAGGVTVVGLLGTSGMAIVTITPVMSV
jgi:hypothetical protein